MEISKLTVLIVFSIFVCQVQGDFYDYSSFDIDKRITCAGESMRLECDVGKIWFIQGWFGFYPNDELEVQCAGTPPTVECIQNRNATMIVTGICEGEFSCEVTVSDEFEDPCGSGMAKYLYVLYMCSANEIRPTEILEDWSILTSSSGDFTGEWPESTQKLTGTCQGCLVWKICVPVIVVVFLILVCVIVFIARRNNMKGKEKKEDRQEQQL